MKVDDESRLETGTIRDFQSPEPAQKKRSQWWIVVLAVLVAVGLVIFGIMPRIQADKDLKKETARMAIPTVAVVQPKRSAPAQEIILPANVQAFADAPIYARTSGYLKRWYVDIGGHVKAGQLLAEIDTPEVTEQLRQARADLATSQANLNAAGRNCGGQSDRSAFYRFRCGGPFQAAHSGIVVDPACQHFALPGRRPARSHGGPGSEGEPETNNAGPRFWQRSRSGSGP